MKMGFFHQHPRKILLVAAVAVLVAVFLVTPRGPREPVYQGKPITQWINEAADIGIFAQTPVTDAAMKVFATNALPFLLNEFIRPVSPWRTRLKSWAGRVPWLKLRVRDDTDRIHTAAGGLMLLGTNGVPAIPVLMNLLGDPTRAYMARELLFNLHEPALAQLIAALASTNAPTVSNALAALRPFAGEPGLTRDALLSVRRHPDAGVRVEAMKTWMVAYYGTEDVVTDLLNMTKDPSPLVVWEASNLLVRVSERGPEPDRTAASNALLTLRTNAPPPRAN